MNDLTIKVQFEKVEFLSKKAQRFKKGYKISFCDKQKKRLAWDHYCATVALKEAQKTYCALIHMMVSENELSQFLEKQNLRIKL